jgi:hypothetical protein
LEINASVICRNVFNVKDLQKRKNARFWGVLFHSLFFVTPQVIAEAIF